MNDTGDSSGEELNFINDLETKGILVSSNALGLEQEYSESYGIIDFQVEERSPKCVYYTLDFDEEAELDFMHKNGRGFDKLLYMLEALSRDIQFETAVGEIYHSGTSKEREIRPFLDSEDRLEKRYLDDLSRLLEQEFWK